MGTYGGGLSVNLSICTSTCATVDNCTTGAQAVVNDKPGIHPDRFVPLYFGLLAGVPTVELLCGA
jgi:hypothetical protein